MYLNEQKKSASVIFESVKEAETCFEIINVRQDLIERAIGKPIGIGWIERSRKKTR